MFFFGLAQLRILIFCCMFFACSKVPLQRYYPQTFTNISAWFEREKTLFLFYDIALDEGFQPDARLEIQVRTDSKTSDWKPVSDFSSVHTHEAVNCGSNHICGSQSLFEPERPLEVRLRVRYLKEGRLSDNIDVFYQSVELNQNAASESASRSGDLSAVLYGVFNSDNNVVQWRLRHQIPGIANEEVRRLGLRRYFRIEERSAGPRTEFELKSRAQNVYAFDASQSICSTSFLPLENVTPLETRAAAIWSQERLDLQGEAMKSAAIVCAKSTMTTALGEFTGLAYALKNPQTESAFGQLSTSVTDTRLLKFLIAPCGRSISNDHLEMQLQRLLMSDNQSQDPDVCLEQLPEEVLTNRIASAFDLAIDRERVNQQDMALVIAFHHDERDPNGLFHRSLFAALARSLKPEQLKSSPRTVGAYVFDSDGSVKLPSELERSVLWCPAAPLILQPVGSEPASDNTAGSDDRQERNASDRACAVLPNLGVQLGPVNVGVLPIFPSRDSYASYISNFGKDFAGKMLDLSVRAPRYTPETERVDVGQFGSATFFDGEKISTTDEQRFSFCPLSELRSPLVARVPAGVQIPEEVQAVIEDNRVVPLSTFPRIHKTLQLQEYDLGLIWDFPFLFSFNYQAFLAGKVSPFGASIPFGIDRTTGEQYGSQIWSESVFRLGDVLLKCTDFCNHPTFDSAGVYNVQSGFEEFYSERCYRPLIPGGVFGSESSPPDP